MHTSSIIQKKIHKLCLLVDNYKHLPTTLPTKSSINYKLFPKTKKPSTNLTSPNVK